MNLAIMAILGVATAAVLALMLRVFLVSREPARHLRRDHAVVAVREFTLARTTTETRFASYRDVRGFATPTLPSLPLQSFPLWNSVLTVMASDLFTLTDRPPRADAPRSHHLFWPIVITADTTPTSVRLTARQVPLISRGTLAFLVACVSTDVIVSLGSFGLCMPAPLSSWMPCLFFGSIWLSNRLARHHREASLEDAFHFIEELIKEHAELEDAARAASAEQ